MLMIIVRLFLVRTTHEERVFAKKKPFVLMRMPLLSSLAYAHACRYSRVCILLVFMSLLS